MTAQGSSTTTCAIARRAVSWLEGVDRDRLLDRHLPEWRTMSPAWSYQIIEDAIECFDRTLLSVTREMGVVTGGAQAGVAEPLLYQAYTDASASSRCVAQEWRSVWTVACLCMPASWTAIRKAR